MTALRLVATLALILCLTACAARTGGWLERYPVVDGHHSILDEDRVTTFDPAELDGFSRREIELIFGPPGDKDLSQTHDESARLPMGTKANVSQDDWVYLSAEGGHKLLLRFIDGFLERLEVIPLEAGAL